MSLSTRLSAFFLAALALALLGFSLTLYYLASRHLDRHLDERLAAALDTLEASIDVEPGGLEWEPQDRRIMLGMESDEDDVRWAICTLTGDVVDRSVNSTALAQSPAGFPHAWRPSEWPIDPPDAVAFGNAGGWRMAGRRLLLEELLAMGRGHPEDDGPENDIEYPALIMTAGLSEAPMQASLRHLSLALAATSAVVWVLSAGVGMWLSRRALSPLTRMAVAARSLSAAEPRGRLPNPNTNDELQELGGAFNELLSRLHEALDRQQRFAGDASHQLRTPLAGMLALVDVVRRRDRPSEEYVTALDQVRDEALRMRQIVESLMFLARPENDALPLPTEAIDLAAWIPEQLGHWGDHARAADLQQDISESELWIKAHPSLLAQLVDNLIDNACKYSEPGTTVVIRAGRRAGRIELSVEDQGAGIAEGDRARLFDPFFRASDAQVMNRKGVGLGLAVAQRIAATLGAAIQVESQLGVGSRFCVTFSEARSLEKTETEQPVPIRH